MRSTLALIAGTALIAAIGYHFVHTEQPRPRHVLAPQAENTDDQKLRSSVVSTLLRQQQLGAESRRQGELDGKLTELDARLKNVETAHSQPAEAPAADDAARKSVPKVSEAELASWVDESLRSEAWDKEWSDQANTEIEKGLAHLPDVKLEEVDCNKRVCRASFAEDDGQRTPAPDLFGLLPFANEGFMIDEPDGRTKVYFTRAGASLKDLRSEALASLR